ncbi:phage distal tail protein [Salibacterium aidingense]|uniref:phage distal tail protein n=1 Tax=Salibacterium aidingense TaxID=384933 RepID=UPI003BD7986B
MIIEYVSPYGDTIEFSQNTAFRATNIEGFGDTRLSELTQRAPYQVGDSLLGARAQSRRPSMTVYIKAYTREQLYALRNDLSRAMMITPAKPGEESDIGILRCHRDGLPTVELEAMPVQSPQFGTISGNQVPADLEFYCPHPYWREIQDSFIEMVESGGFEFPMEMPLEMATFNLQQEIENQGDVPVHPFFRIYGAVTQPRLINLTTGEMIEISGSVAEGEYIEIQTAFGRKRIERVQNGTRENAMHRLNINDSTFFQLQRGINTIRFEADQNTSGRALIYWRARYGGV